MRRSRGAGGGVIAYPGSSFGPPQGHVFSYSPSPPGIYTGGPYASQPIGGMGSYPALVYPSAMAHHGGGGGIAPRGQIHGAHENLRRVLDDNKALETKIEKLQSDLSEMKTQNESLSSQVTQLTQENSELRDELAIYEKARNHPIVGEAVRSLTRNVNLPQSTDPSTRQAHGWCWT